MKTTTISAGMLAVSLACAKAAAGTRGLQLYQYLAESIRKHPDQQTLATMMEAAGFGRVSVRNLSAGIVAVHRGWKV